MTLAQVLQLYAPFVGLLGVVFWLGVLSQRVKNLEERCKKLETESDDGSADHDLLVRLETTMTEMAKRLDSFDRSMQGVQRQLGNLMLQGTGGKVIELGDHG